MSRPRATLLTPSGRGAIAAFAVWGEGALELVERLFRPARAQRPLRTTPNLPRLGRIGRGAGDEAVVVWDHETRDVEIHCHGGVQATRCVLEALLASGVSVASRVAYLKHAYPGRIEAHATADLLHASTARTAGILLAQQAGALRLRVQEIVSALGPTGANDQACLAALEELLDRAKLGLRLLSGWTVQLAGPPNAGKSCLFNALLGFERSIVHHQPGTTRDLVSQPAAFHGWPVLLTDSAGIRATDHPLESAGVARATAQLAASDLVLLVFDRSTAWHPENDRLLGEHPNALVVATKCDLPPAWREHERAAIAVSALTGENLAALVEAIGLRLVPSPPTPGCAVPFRQQQVKLIQAARALLQQAARPRAERALNLMLK